MSHLSAFPQTASVRLPRAGKEGGALESSSPTRKGTHFGLRTDDRVTMNNQSGSRLFYSTRTADMNLIQMQTVNIVSHQATNQFMIKIELSLIWFKQLYSHPDSVSRQYWARLLITISIGHHQNNMQSFTIALSSLGSGYPRPPNNEHRLQ